MSLHILFRNYETHFRTGMLVHRIFSTFSNNRKSLLLGFYEGEKDGEFTLTKSTQGFLKNKAPKLTELMQLSGLVHKKGKCRIFHGLDHDYGSVAMVNLGKRGAGYSEQEEVDESRENIRTAVANGVNVLQGEGVKSIDVDPCGEPDAAAEGAVLRLFSYEDLKAKNKHKDKPSLDCYTAHVDDASSVRTAWDRGTILGEGQNLARHLMEAPSNVMTPTKFSELAQERLSKFEKVELKIRNKQWAESMNMGAFLGVARGSDEPLRFVEMHYKGGKEGSKPLVIVGKGITFDSGGISIKPSTGMHDMRADMGGAACTLATIYTIARLQLPINVIGLTPLCENMPGGRACKPGDVLTAMNGTTIQVDNTDAEGRLILSDALCFADTFSPRGILDMATLTGAMMVALGAGATGVFTNSKLYWETMHKAGALTGDRVWRMPLFKLYSKQMTECHLADINNISNVGKDGGSCTAAAFLKEFVKSEHWMHLDIAGVMGNKKEVPYLDKGMTGRPTRTIVEFVNRLSRDNL